jgi:hypothetical protein
MPSSGLLRRVVPVRTDISEELSASFIKVTKIGDLGTMLAISLLVRNRTVPIERPPLVNEF